MKTLFRIVDGLLLAACACCFGIGFLLDRSIVVPAALVFLLINIVPSPVNFRIKSLRLRVCAEGTDLLAAFLIAVVLVPLAHVAVILFTSWLRLSQFIISCVAAVVFLSILFWNGILRVYLTSVQLGIKTRVIGILCGWIPIANLIALGKILSVTNREVRFEYEKETLNARRQEQRICATKYPIVLVHGVFFRDSRYVNYWGRIPKELIQNGAVIHYGNHQSALSVAESGAELAARIEEIVRTTGCEKVNVIAHSKGGLDCRYAIAHCGAEVHVASLTTINTPHRGCLFADYLLEKVPEKAKNAIARTYNAALRRLGDQSPDFLAAVYDLTDRKCRELNETMPDSAAVFCRSVGSRLNRATNGKFPLNFTYHLVKHFDGPNDGLVSEPSFHWGSEYLFLTTEGRRGISHGDMIDMNRENIKGFDVREFYVGLVADLKERGF